MYRSTGTVCRLVTFILAAFFLALVREKSDKDLRMPHKSPFVIVLNITLFIGCQYQRCPHYCLGQGTGAPLSLENAAVSFAACPVTIFAALPRAIDRSNAKLGEDVKQNSKVCLLCLA